MNIDELLEFLEIEDPSEFQYFENLADIIETDAEISEAALNILMKDVDTEVLSEIMHNYFEEILKGIPDSETEFYTHLQTISMSMVGMSRALEDERDVALFCQELLRFKNWYIDDSVVEIRPKDSNTKEYSQIPLMEAVAAYRTENLGGEQNEYDFSKCMDYGINDYAMSFASLAVNEYDEDELQRSAYELDKSDLETMDGKLIDGFVYDDEFSDEE